MKGSFSLGLLEVLAYVASGAVVVLTLSLFCYPSLLVDAAPSSLLVAGLLLASYVAGHGLTVMSCLLVWVRVGLNLAIGQPKREERYEFYADFRTRLGELLSPDSSKKEEYLYALRLVAERCPASLATVDRLYALTLFSRNAAAAFLVSALFCLRQHWSVALVSLGLVFVFFVRYVQFERSTESTVFRSAHLYLVLKGEEAR